MNPATDTPHCDVTDAQAIQVSARRHPSRPSYRVRAGIVGDGYCGTAGHPTCVIGVGTAEGPGHRRRITFSHRRRHATTTTTTDRRRLTPTAHASCSQSRWL